MKSFLLLFCLILLENLKSQIFNCDFETWSDNHHPAGFWGAKTNIEVDSVVKYSTSVHGGSFAVQLINTESTHKRFTTQPLSVDSGTVYTISFWVRGKGNVRTGIYDGRTSGNGYYYNSYVNVNTLEWQYVTQSVTAEVTTTSAEFIFSVQYTNSANDHIQIDDVQIFSGTPQTPTITITSPANNSTLYSSNVSIVFNVTNFNIGQPGPNIDGHIKYTVNNLNPQMHYSTSPISLTLNEGSYTVVLELVDNNNNSLNPPILASVTFNIVLNMQFTSIYNIQYTTDPSGNSPLVDDTVLTGGIVTGVHSQGFFIQSGYGMWNGIYVYAPTYSSQLSIGDSVTIVGKVKEYYGLTEITNLANLTIHSSGNALPQPYIVNATTVKTEPFEGVLVKILNAKCINPNAGYGMWTVKDYTNDSCKIHNLLYSYTPVLNKIYNITGPVYYAYQEYRIEPRSENDIEIVGNVSENPIFNTVVYPVEFVNEINVKSNVKLLCINVISENGKVIKSFSDINSTCTTLKLNNLRSGIYLIEVRTENTTTIQKVIKIQE
ncbi:MAG: carbohydrate binding domain-containing protein [Bacteroidales bacterium]|nr:carbohydrate binding domain-containing protein [Bacteroidales bacterium]